jgi:hypothetical protein
LIEADAAETAAKAVVIGSISVSFFRG